MAVVTFLDHGATGALETDMPLDTSIYNALMAPQKSMLSYADEFADRDAKREQRDMLRQQNALQIQSMRDTSAEKARGVSERNALAGLYSQGAPDFSKPETQAELYRVAPSLADSVLKTHGELAERAAKTKNQEADTIKAQAEAEKTKLATSYMMRDRHLQYLDGVQDLQGAAQWIQEGVQLGEFKPEQAQQIMGALQSGRMPLEQWKINAQKGGMTLQQQARDRMEQLEFGLNQDKAKEQARHNRTSEGLTARGQNMADSRAREANELQRNAARTQIIVDPTMGVLAVDKGSGTFKPVKDASGSAIPGEAAVASRKRADQLQYGITEARKLIPQATGSGLGAARDAAGNMIGMSSQANDAATQLETLSGWLTANVPRMEGPQSNADMIMYQRMAADIGNRKLPQSARMKALDTLETLQGKYQNKGGSNAGGLTVVRTGTDKSGRRVQQMSDGSIQYAD